MFNRLYELTKRIYENEETPLFIGGIFFCIDGNEIIVEYACGGSAFLSCDSDITDFMEEIGVPVEKLEKAINAEF